MAAGRVGFVPRRPAIFRERTSIRDMKAVLLGLMVLVAAGCAGLSRTAADRAFCEAEPTDQVERQATRELCR